MRSRQGELLWLTGQGQISRSPSLDGTTLAFPEHGILSELWLAGEMGQSETFRLGTPIPGVVDLSRNRLPLGRLNLGIKVRLFLQPHGGLVLLGAVGSCEMAIRLEGGLLLGMLGSGLSGGGLVGGFGGRTLHEEGVLGRSGKIGVAFEEVVILGLWDWKTVALDHFLLKAEANLPAELHAANKYNPSSTTTHQTACLHPQSMIITRLIRRYFTQSKPNYYALFGLTPGFTEQQLKTAYLELVKKYHPDLTQDPSAKDIFRQVQEGYELLSNQASRVQYQQTQEAPERQEGQAVVEEMRERFLKNFSRKDPINDEFNFSHRLFREHYEKVEEPKKEYTKYEGQDREYYARNDEEAQKLWKQVGAAVSAVAVVAGAYLYTRP